jgi:acyl-CoA reductase-like NAD-dependent aldehyde dehydrogenase
VGLPPGVLNLVFGYGPTCGEALVLHPKVSMGSSGFSIHFIGKETRIEALALKPAACVHYGCSFIVFFPQGFL